MRKMTHALCLGIFFFFSPGGLWPVDKISFIQVFRTLIQTSKVLTKPGRDWLRCLLHRAKQESAVLQPNVCENEGGRKIRPPGMRPDPGLLNG